MARRVAVALGLRLAAGHHGEPVLRVVGADLADGLPRDQGRRGPRVRLRRRRVRLALPGVQRRRRRARGVPQPALRRGPGPHRRRPRPPTRPGTTRGRTACCPTSTSRWARPPRTSRPRGASAAQEQDEFGVRSQNLAEKAIADGFFDREIIPITTPDGTVVARDDGPRPGVTLEGVAGLKPVFRERRHGHRRQLLPAQRRRRRGRDHVRHPGRRARPHPAGPDRVHRGVRPVPRDHGPRPGGGAPGARWSLAGMTDRRHGPGRDQRGVRGPGHPVLPGARASTWTGSTCTAARSRSATRSGPPAPGSPRRCSTACRARDKEFGLETMCVGGGQGMAMVLQRLS